MRYLGLRAKSRDVCGTSAVRVSSTPSVCPSVRQSRVINDHYRSRPHRRRRRRRCCSSSRASAVSSLSSAGRRAAATATATAGDVLWRVWSRAGRILIHPVACLQPAGGRSFRLSTPRRVKPRYMTAIERPRRTCAVYRAPISRPSSVVTSSPYSSLDPFPPAHSTVVFFAAAGSRHALGLLSLLGQH